MSPYVWDEPGFQRVGERFPDLPDRRFLYPKRQLCILKQSADGRNVRVTLRPLSLGTT